VYASTSGAAIQTATARSHVPSVSAGEDPEQHRPCNPLASGKE
jgi:hypothetical protein